MKMIIYIDNLKDYLHYNKISYRDFAQKAGISVAMLTLICNGKQSPSFKTAKILSQATDGAISTESIMRFGFENRLEQLLANDGSVNKRKRKTPEKVVKEEDVWQLDNSGPIAVVGEEEYYSSIVKGIK